jgi:hypothetical protein
MSLSEDLSLGHNQRLKNKSDQKGNTWRRQTGKASLERPEEMDKSWAHQFVAPRFQTPGSRILSWLLNPNHISEHSQQDLVDPLRIGSV